ncbi:MAG: hypothetical protein IJ479_09340, partial [Alphaproteobacteria bacterium]|nr:hypothetical protein [Alphaproteobacteria bacterium]
SDGCGGTCTKCSSCCNSSSSNWCSYHGTCHGDCCKDGTWDSCDERCGGSGCSGGSSGGGTYEVWLACDNGKNVFYRTGYYSQEECIPEIHGCGASYSVCPGTACVYDVCN